MRGSLYEGVVWYALEAFNPLLMKHFHSAHVIAHLERGGLTLDMFRLHMGDALLIETAGNGDTYYDWNQVMAYYKEKANVPVN